MLNNIKKEVCDIRLEQENQSRELVRMRTIQDANSLSIKILNDRVSTLEQYNQSTMKQWVDDNYVRIPQNKNK
jgi:hypothetical protein